MPLDRTDFAEECVRQGVYVGVEPHYLLAVAQLRSGISSDDDGERKGPFRLTQAEWDNNRNDDEFDIHFTADQINSPLRQCTVCALMANRALKAFVLAKNRNPTSKELYLQQFPGADASGLHGGLGAPAPFAGAAAAAVLDEPQAVTTLPDSAQPTPGPAVITPD